MQRQVTLHFMSLNNTISRLEQIEPLVTIVLRLVRLVWVESPLAQLEQVVSIGHAWKSSGETFKFALGLHLCCRLCCELGRHTAWVCSISQRFRSQIQQSLSAFCFFCSQPWFLWRSKHINKCQSKKKANKQQKTKQNKGGAPLLGLAKSKYQVRLHFRNFKSCGKMFHSTHSNLQNKCWKDYRTKLETTIMNYRTPLNFGVLPLVEVNHVTR